MANELTEEIATYKASLSGWIDQEGKFVLIHKTDVGGFFDTYEEALRTGYERFGLVPFMVKQVRKQQQAHFVSRLMVPQQV